MTFDHPPINTITATTVAELAELVDLIEQDPDLNVVVFDSANPDFYLAHYDTAFPRPGCPLGSTVPGPTVAGAGGQHRVDPRTRPRRRKRVRLACDLCFASRKNTVLEIPAVGDDLDGPRAEQYGYVDRVIADTQLDDEVDQIASRLARFDHA